MLGIASLMVIGVTIGTAAAHPGPSSLASNSPVGQSKFVKDAISRDHVVIFSKSYCPYSAKAKEVFKSLPYNFTAIELDHRNDGSSIQDELQKITGARTVPRIFIDGKFVGGSSDIKALYDNGKLQKMLLASPSAK